MWYFAHFSEYWIVDGQYLKTTHVKTEWSKLFVALRAEDVWPANWRGVPQAPELQKVSKTSCFYTLGGSFWYLFAVKKYRSLLGNEG